MVEEHLPPELSVIVPVGARHADAIGLHAEYKAGLDALDQSYELIYVLDGPCEAFAAGLRALLDKGQRFTVISLTRSFGESTALMAGFEQSTGQTILTLPAYHQIVGAEVAKLVAALSDCDIAIGRRWPRAGGAFERMRRALFHGLLGSITGVRFRDLGCGARAFARRVLDDIQLYGDQHRFLAVLADRQGFVVREVDLQQSPADRFDGVYRPARIRAWLPGHLHDLLPGALYEKAAALFRDGRRFDLCDRLGAGRVAGLRTALFRPGPGRQAGAACSRPCSWCWACSFLRWGCSEN